MLCRSKKRTRAQATKRVKFKSDTIFYERVGPYVPPVRTQKFATINTEDDDADENSDESDDDEWVRRCAGAGAVVYTLSAGEVGCST